MLTDETSLDEDFGARVRAARLRRGLSLRSVARSLQISPGTLSQVETGRTRLSVARLSQIATVLGTTVDGVLSADHPEASGTAPRDDLNPVDQDSGSAPGPAISDWRQYGPTDFDPILQAALNVFVATGYHSATVRDVARECGMSVAGIYHHYQNKHQLLSRILDLGVSELLHRAELARAEGTSAVERFSLLVESLVLFHTHRREIAFVGASEMRSLTPEVHGDVAMRRMEQQRMIDHEVLAAVAEGRFHASPPLEASRAVVTMCTSVAQWFKRDGPQTPGDLAANYVRFGLDLMRHEPL